MPRLGWVVRERRRADGTLQDCFVEAPREGNMAYALEVLGDDYTGYGDVERKHEHCKQIVAWANSCSNLDNETIIAVGRQYFRNDANTSPEVLAAFCNAVRHCARIAETPVAIDMVLYCPNCHVQHIDAPNMDMLHVGANNAAESARLWTNPPHRSHLCRPQDGGCGFVWRPADVPTNGVAAIKTKGQHDGPVTVAADARGPYVAHTKEEVGQMLDKIVAAGDDPHLQTR